MKLIHDSYQINRSTITELLRVLEANSICSDDEGEEWNNDPVIKIHQVLETECEKQNQ